MNDPDRLRLALAEPRAHVLRVGRLAPLVPQVVDLGAVAPDHAGPALAEVAGRHDEVRLSRRDEIRHRRLERPGARGGEEEHVALRAANLTEPRQAALVDRPEIGAAVMDDRLGERGEHLRRHGRRPGSEEVLLACHQPRD